MARIGTVVIVMLWCAGCATTIAFDRVSPNHYPSRSDVEVLASEPTDVDVEELGELTLKSATLTQKLIDELAAKAGAMGADAIIVAIESRGKSGSRIPMGDALNRSEEGDMRGVDTTTVRIDVRAVKYHRLGTFEES